MTLNGLGHGALPERSYTGHIANTFSVRLVYQSYYSRQKTLLSFSLTKFLCITKWFLQLSFKHRSDSGLSACYLDKVQKILKDFSQFRIIWLRIRAQSGFIFRYSRYDQVYFIIKLLISVIIFFISLWSAKALPLPLLLPVIGWLLLRGWEGGIMTRILNPHNEAGIVMMSGSIPEWVRSLYASFLHLSVSV